MKLSTILRRRKRAGERKACERRSRAAAGLLLGTAVLSLLVSVEPVPPVEDHTPTSIVVAGQAERYRMSVYSPADAGPKTIRYRSSAGMIDMMEAWIERYPWPTLFIGLGLGFILAHRMRL